MPRMGPKMWRGLKPRPEQQRHNGRHLEQRTQDGDRHWQLPVTTIPRLWEGQLRGANCGQAASAAAPQGAIGMRRLGALFTITLCFVT